MTIHIALCPDNNYTMPTTVLVRSICENAYGQNIHFHIITNQEFFETNKNALINEFNSDKVGYTFYKISPELLDYFSLNKQNSPAHITMSAYIRLYLSTILPREIDKILYLDSDIIVRQPLDELYQTNISGYSLAAVSDINEITAPYYNRLRYPISHGYFNTGVQLINLAYWREHSIEKSFVTYAQKYPECIVFQDQDIENAVLHGTILFLPLKYNCQTSFLYKKEFLNIIYYDKEAELEEAVHNPVIIHYCVGAAKPWLRGCTHPYKDAFLNYKAMTQWADIPLLKVNRPLKNRIELLLKKLLHRLPQNPYREDLPKQMQ